MGGVASRPSDRPGVGQIGDPLHNGTILARLFDAAEPLIRCPIYVETEVTNDDGEKSIRKITYSSGGERVTLDSSCDVTTSRGGIVVTEAGEAVKSLQFNGPIASPVNGRTLTPGSTIPSQLALLTVGWPRSRLFC
jgi:hypothetical protein